MRKRVLIVALPIFFLALTNVALAQEEGKFEKKLFKGSRFFADSALALDTGTTIHRMTHRYSGILGGYDANNNLHIVAVNLKGIPEAGTFRFVSQRNTAAVATAMVGYGFGRDLFLGWLAKKGEWHRRVATGLYIASSIVSFKAGLGNLSQKANLNRAMWIQYGLRPTPYPNPWH